MEIKDLNELTSDQKAAYQKALQAIEKNNPEYAIAILMDIVLREPAFLQGREKLRVAEKILHSSYNFVKRSFLAIKAKKIVKMAKIDFMRGKYADAIAKIEEALSIDAKETEALMLLADAGVALKMEFLATHAYECAYSLDPENKNIIITLANHYRKLGKGKDELKLRQKLVDMHPNKLEYQQEMRSAGAMAAMERSGDEKIGSFRDMIKDTKEAQLLEQQEKQVHSINDIKELLDTMLKKFQAEPDNIQNIRDIAWAYYKAAEYDEALKYFNLLEEKQDVFDLPSNKATEITINEINKAKLDEINQRLEAGIETAEKERLKAIKINILTEQLKTRKIFAEKRVSAYPNDVQLKFDLGKVYWDLKAYDRAIEQFQISQKHPKFHFSSNVFLGKCFYEKGQNEFAIDQFKKVITMEGNDVDLLDAVYYLGLAFERINDIQNAKECFKKVYSVSSKYKDIAQKISLYFENKK